MKDKSAKSGKRGKKKARADGLRALPNVALSNAALPTAALPAPALPSATDRPHDGSLLDVSRIQWQHGDWADLARMDADTLQAHPERARLALIVAAAHAQLGDTTTARLYAEQALQWGCSRSVAAQVLISSAHNALARVATALQDTSAQAHFTDALRLVEPHGDLPLLARSRQIRETARMGLLPEAANLLAIDLAEVARAPADHADRIAMLDSRLREVQNALVASRSAAPAPETNPD